MHNCPEESFISEHMKESESYFGSFWYRRHPNHSGDMGLVNNGNYKDRPSFELVSPSAGNTCGKLYTDEDSFGKGTNPVSGSRTIVFSVRLMIMFPQDQNKLRTT